MAICSQSILYGKYGRLLCFDPPTQTTVCIQLHIYYFCMLNLQILGSGGTIIWVMLLSVVFLKVKYHLLHIAGAGVCLLGIGTLAYADISSGKSNNGSIQLNEIMIHK